MVHNTSLPEDSLNQACLLYLRFYAGHINLQIHVHVMCDTLTAAWLTNCTHATIFIMYVIIFIMYAIIFIISHPSGSLLIKHAHEVKTWLMKIPSQCI